MVALLSGECKYDAGHRSLIGGEVALDLSAYLLSLEFWRRNGVVDYVRPIYSIDWWHPTVAELVSRYQYRTTAMFVVVSSYQSSTLRGKYS